MALLPLPLIPLDMYIQIAYKVLCVIFEWDETKRQTNLEKHHLDFRDARLIFDGRNAVHVPALKNEEARFLSIAIIGDKFYTAVWTWRQPARRIISFRRSRHGDENAYHQIHG